MTNSLVSIDLGPICQSVADLFYLHCLTPLIVALTSFHKERDLRKKEKDLIEKKMRNDRRAVIAGRKINGMRWQKHSSRRQVDGKCEGKKTYRKKFPDSYAVHYYEQINSASLTEFKSESMERALIEEVASRPKQVDINNSKYTTTPRVSGRKVKKIPGRLEASRNTQNLTNDTIGTIEIRKKTNAPPNLGLKNGIGEGETSINCKMNRRLDNKSESTSTDNVKNPVLDYGNSDIDAFIETIENRLFLTRSRQPRTNSM